MSIVLETISLNSDTELLIGQEAGPSDAHEKVFLKQIHISREHAEADFRKAIYAEIFKKRQDAEQYISSSLKYMMEAFWRAEDTEYEKSQHVRLHEIAKWKHDNLGCRLIKAGDNYVQRCSIVLTHKRVGFSMGFTGRSTCMLCKKDEFECEHVRGMSYWVKGGTDKQGLCSACGNKECTQHNDKHVYRVCPSLKVNKPKLYEVSMVKKPAIPTARLTEVPVSKKVLEEAAGEIDETMGMSYLCHVCKGECPGFQEFDLG